MHERLEEINCPLPRNVYTPTSVEGLDSDMQDVLGMGGGEQDVPGGLTEGGGEEGGAAMMMMEDDMMLDQPDFDFQLNMLPVWAQKAALSRPSVAQQAASSKEHLSSDSSGTTHSVGSRMAEGKWAEVRMNLVGVGGEVTSSFLSFRE